MKSAKEALLDILGKTQLHFCDCKYAKVIEGADDFAVYQIDECLPYVVSVGLSHEKDIDDEFKDYDIIMSVCIDYNMIAYLIKHEFREYNDTQTDLLSYIIRSLVANIVSDASSGRYMNYILDKRSEWSDAKYVDSLCADFMLRTQAFDMTTGKNINEEDVIEDSKLLNDGDEKNLNVNMYFQS